MKNFKNFKKLWMSVAIGLAVGLLFALFGVDSVGLTIAIILFSSLVSWFVMTRKKADGSFKQDKL